MTNYEQIKNFTIDQMALFIHTIVEVIEKDMQKYLDSEGVEVTLVKPPLEMQLAMNKAYLMQEVEDDR